MRKNKNREQVRIAVESVRWGAPQYSAVIDNFYILYIDD